MTVLQVLSYPRENPEAAGISITIKHISFMWLEEICASILGENAEVLVSPHKKDLAD